MAGRLIAFAVLAVVLAHFAVPAARAMRPLLEAGALLAIIALAFWVMLIAPVRNRLSRHF